jgi:hypothetical protein
MPVTTFTWRRDSDDGKRLLGEAASHFARSHGLPIGDALAEVVAGLAEVHVLGVGMVHCVWTAAPSQRQKRAIGRAADSLTGKWTRCKSDVRHLVPATVGD